MRLCRHILALMLLWPGAAHGADIPIDQYLVLERVGRSGRSPILIDPIERMRVTGAWRAPAPGDAVKSSDGRDLAWWEAKPGDDGWLTGEGLAGAYAYATVVSDSERVMLLDAAGHGMVFVNGEPRAGDPYEYGFVRLPVLLKKGTNEFLFTIARGRLRARLTEPPKGVFIDLTDLTISDEGPPTPLMAGVVVVNATQKAITPIVSGTGAISRREDSFRIAPLSLRKIPIARFRGSPASVVVVNQDGQRDSVGITPRQRAAGQTYKVGFVSGIDGSVQYYAVNPAGASGDKPRALVFSLHGASVEATNQADAYSSKPWADIVCPTNRRPYGFDWEDWGRLDALEVLEDATARLRPDPSQIYLTGHSMGGHGTWIIGSLFPDKFAAIGPSAGWISFSTYASTQPSTQPTSPLGDLMRRAASASDTASVFPNLAQLGVYILHGATDDNVPADQARQMVTHLSKFHKDFVYHEQPQAGHWWESSDEPGAECVDWAPMFDFFARRRRPSPAQVRQVDFVTPSPSVTSRCHWIEIEAQRHAMRPCSVTMRVEPGKRRYTGTTQNVQRLAIDLVHFSGVSPIQLQLDSDQPVEIAWPVPGRLWLERTEQGWRAINQPSAALKNPRRGGPFKDAFRNRMQFVYGTKGTPEENAWALAKARYDAEVWWYRGNGSVDVVADVEFDPREDLDRNLILYGNADTISCWDALLSSSPVQIKRGTVAAGSRTESSSGLACLFLRPRPGSDMACVAVIGGSGITGMRLTDRLPIFVSGVGYPDMIMFDPDVLRDGARAIRCAGFFGNDWSIGSGEFVWRE